MCTFNVCTLGIHIHCHKVSTVRSMCTHFILQCIFIAPLVTLRQVSQYFFKTIKLWEKALYNTSFGWHITMHEPISYAHANYFCSDTIVISTLWTLPCTSRINSNVWSPLTSWLSINLKFSMWGILDSKTWTLDKVHFWTQFVITPAHMCEVGLSGWFCPSVLLMSVCPVEMFEICIFNEQSNRTPRCS